MYYKLSPREEIYNRKYKVTGKKEYDRQVINPCLLFICIYMSISVIITILFHLHTINLFMYSFTYY